MEVFIIFHKSLFVENYLSFSQSETLRLLRWVAVNEAFSKQIPSSFPISCILHEHLLTFYDPLLQLSNYYQNSFFFHLAMNPSIATKEYVGFAQYDMNLPAELFRSIEAKILEHGAPTIYGMYPYPFEALYSNPLSHEDWRELLRLYNSHSNTNHDFESLKLLPLFLCHTFILPTSVFLECMEFVRKTVPFCLRKLGWNTRHLAGTFERVIAITISCKILEKKIQDMVHVKGVDHLASQHDADPLRGLKEGLQS